MFFVGALVGTLLFGWVSDYFGRYWTLILSNINIMVMGISTPFANGFVAFSILRFLTGLSFPTCFMCIYMLSNFFEKFVMGTIIIVLFSSFGICLHRKKISSRQSKRSHWNTNRWMHSSLDFKGCRGLDNFSSYSIFSVFHHIISSLVISIIF